MCMFNRHQLNFDVFDKSSFSHHHNGTIPYDPLCKGLPGIKVTEFCLRLYMMYKKAVSLERYINRLKITQFIRLIRETIQRLSSIYMYDDRY